jgi:hypothetical protein
VPISVFFGQAPPFAPIFHYVQRRIQYIQIADFCCFPLFRKALCDLFVLFFLQFHSFILAYLYLCEQTLRGNVFDAARSGYRIHKKRIGRNKNRRFARLDKASAFL